MAEDPSPVPSAPGGPAWERLEDQLAWYEAASRRARRSYQSLKALEIVTAAAIPVVVAVGVEDWLAAVLGAVVVVLEGIQQLYQFQQNWIRYRGAAEALKRERTLFAAEGGPYARGARSQSLLAERIEGMLGEENAGWASARQDAGGGGGGGSGG